MSRRARFATFLALDRNMVLLLGTIVLIGSGEEMWMRFLPKYLEGLGASAFLIGTFDAIKTLLGAVYAFPGGVLVDRWGHRRAFVVFCLLSILGYTVLLVTSSWPGVIFGMFFFLAWSNLSLPATFSLVARSLPASKHAMGIGIQSLVRRLPALIGPVAGGLLMDRMGLIPGVHAGVAVTIILAACALPLQSTIRAGETPPSKLHWNLLRHLRDFDPNLRSLLASDILIRFCERLPFAWVVIYAMDNGHASAAQAGILIAVEMIAATVCYVPASYLADRFGKGPFVVVTFIFFTLFPLSLMVAHNFAWLVLAFAIRGLKEFGEPARKSLIISYAPADVRGQTIGAYYLVRDTVVTVGSFIGAALWKLGPNVNFASAAALGAIGTVFYLATRPRSS